MTFKMFLLILAGLCYGLLAAAGVFTVLIAVGLIPRFAGKTHTGKYVFLYEEAVIAGTAAGGVLSVFGDGWDGGVLTGFLSDPGVRMAAGTVFLVIFGLFCGMFVGCLALAIAEMLDSIPIFARRVSLRHGIGLAVFSMAAGKLAGSLFYFIERLHSTVE